MHRGEQIAWALLVGGAAFSIERAHGEDVLAAAWCIGIPAVVVLLTFLLPHRWPSELRYTLITLLCLVGGCVLGAGLAVNAKDADLRQSMLGHAFLLVGVVIPLSKSDRRQR